MIRLFIDNQEADTDQSTSAPISLGIASITRIDAGRTGYSKTISIPMTARNRAIVGDAAEIHGADQFNQQPHTARIEADGFTVIEGSPMMLRCETTVGGAGWYRICIIGPGKEWIDRAAAGMFNEIPIPFDETINADTVFRSWTWDQPVRFFPVLRDSFGSSSGTLAPSVRMMTFTDYHPFINIRALLDAIATQAGYSIRSDFMDGAYFRSLYISGNYPEKEVGAFHATMGFRAGRFADATAVADRFGRVYADPFTSISSVGNIVDTADPEEQQDGVAVTGVYNTNGCFRKDGTRIAYYPAEKVAVGFEYGLTYRSDYRIASRTELRCFDRVYLDDDVERRFKVVNRYEDRRSTYHGNFEYRLIVFDHAAGNGYRFTYDRANASGGTTVVELKTFAERSTLVGVQTEAVVSNPRLWLLASGSYAPYPGDWAIYDGYVEETGQVDITLTVRSAAREASPSSPRYFDLFHFGGAGQGMGMTLRRVTTLRPIFLPHPCEGNRVEFAELAAHRIRQTELITAMKQMFNLYFYSDPLTRTIYIEPREQFYRTEIEIDWSAKIDLSRPVSIEELGTGMPRDFTLRYREGDGSIARWDEAKKEIFGRWSSPVLNRFAREGENNYQNPVFTPTLNAAAAYPDARQATLVQAGDRFRSGIPGDTENLNFPPKIVRFTGIETLPDGQTWGWPAYRGQYPRVAFHDPGGPSPFTLCFEDRDGLQGLHGYYDKNLELYNRGRRISLYLRLNPEDVEPLISPNGLCRDFRARFRLRVGGETLLCRLEEIRDYNPAGEGLTLCIFLKND